MPEKEAALRLHMYHKQKESPHFLGKILRTRFNVLFDTNLSKLKKRGNRRQVKY